MHKHGRLTAYRLSGRPPLLRGLRLALAVVAATALCGFGAAAVLATPSFPSHVCGYFFRSGQDFIVYNAGGLSCQKATKLIKDFVLGKAKQHGTTDAGSYWTIESAPGFECTQAMSEGQCFKGHEIAGYLVKGSG